MMNVVGNAKETINKITTLDSLDLDILAGDTLQTDSIAVGTHVLSVMRYRNA